MGTSPATRPTLLVRLRDSKDAEAWAQFVRLYTPLIYRYALGRDLQPHDAADVSQEVMKSVAMGISKLEYESVRGSFRGWLLTLTRRKLADFWEARQRQALATGDTSVHQLLENLSDEQERQQWEEEFRRCIFDWAARRARVEFTSSTWSAFWQTAVENQAVKDVAHELGLSVGAIYIAKCRVMSRLKQLVGNAIDDEGLELRSANGGFYVHPT